MQLIHTWETEAYRYLAYVTTRTDGHNEGNVGLHVGDDAELVIANRERFFTEANLSLIDSVWADQVHGTRVATVDEADKGKGAYRYDEAIQATDGLVTTATDLPLALVFADCVPLFFCAKDHGIIGMAHAGWKGTVGNIVSSMPSMPSRPKHMRPRCITNQNVMRICHCNESMRHSLSKETWTSSSRTCRPLPIETFSRIGTETPSVDLPPSSSRRRNCEHS
ncbi:laccase domain-containing protein [Exiguobacterium sp. s142]|uniref:polyphenol oxidase family protein n=1 Tax=Exiguobacterium sp. s142 TaxID=2751222 RepID=UPI0020370CDD|nr:laccase domain-containing protein [Exiguobacterium sp. s142]